MNTKLKEVFKGKVVNKALTLNTGVDEFPRYVLEYLIDNYCAEETFREDMQKVVRRLKDNFVYGATKAGLDAFGQGLGDSLVGTGVRVVVVRPGFVRTKMTEGMEAAPFSTTPEKVAELIVAGLAKGQEVIWAPPILQLPFSVFRLLPRSLWRIVADRAGG